MHKNLVKIPTRDMSKEEWLEQRRKSIGGSDAAAILGLNPWSSPYSIWADKTSRITDDSDNEAMRQGRDLEDYVASRWCEDTGKKVRRANAIYANPDYPFAHANVDRLIVGEDAGLECKTTSTLNLKLFKGGAYPDTYYVQCVHYMAVTGAKRWYLGVLVLGKGFYSFVIQRDEEEIQALMKQEAEFWEYVSGDIPPPVDGVKPTTDAIQSIYKDDNGGGIELFGRDILIREYYDLTAQKEALETKVEEIKQTLMLDLGENETGFTSDHKITWKSQVRTAFDAKRFAADHPEIPLDGYNKTSRFRVFKIKEIANHG